MWATVADVLSITKATVTDADISAAQTTIEILTDVTEESDRFLFSKNRRLLKCAVAYQAAWVADHPDTYTAIDVNSATQDGLAYTTTNELAAMLSPHARGCINRLSWKRNRSIYIRKGGARRNHLPNHLNTTDALLDDNRTDWQPLD